MNIETALGCLAEAVSAPGGRLPDLEDAISQWRDRVTNDEAMPDTLADEVSDAMTEAVRIIWERRLGQRSIRVCPGGSERWTFQWYDGNAEGDFAAAIRQYVESAINGNQG